MRLTDNFYELDNKAVTYRETHGTYVICICLYVFIMQIIIFYRMIRNMGWARTSGGAGMDEKKFLKNSFFSIWDISTARSPPTDFGN